MSDSTERLRKVASYPDEMHGPVGSVLMGDVRFALAEIERLHNELERQSQQDTHISTLMRELAEARDKVTSLQAAVMAHKTWENEAVAQASNANLALNKIRVENAALRAEADAWRVRYGRVSDALTACAEESNAARAEVERAFRAGFHEGWDDYRCEENNGPVLGVDAAWSRYQQEREGGEG